MSLFILVRHAQTTLNVEQRVNGDPSVPVELTEQGVTQARLLQLQLAHLSIDLCVHTRFERTRRTAEIALEGHETPFREEPLLDDIDIGRFEGRTTADYRAWKSSHSRSDPFPGGESLDQAAARYARAFAGLAAGGVDTLLVVCHEIALRYMLNGAAASGSLEHPVHNVPNATPFLFETATIARAVEGIERIVHV